MFLVPVALFSLESSCYFLAWHPQSEFLLRILWDPGMVWWSTSSYEGDGCNRCEARCSCVPSSNICMLPEQRWRPSGSGAQSKKIVTPLLRQSTALLLMNDLSWLKVKDMRLIHSKSVGAIFSVHTSTLGSPWSHSGLCNCLGKCKNVG